MHLGSTVSCVYLLAAPLRKGVNWSALWYVVQFGDYLLCFRSRRSMKGEQNFVAPTWYAHNYPKNLAFSLIFFEPSQPQKVNLRNKAVTCSRDLLFQDLSYCESHIY